MRIIIKKTTATLLTLAILCSFAAVLTSAASDPDAVKTKYYSYADTYPTVTSSGLLTITNSYIANGSGFTGATIRTYVDKCFFGNIWIRIGNGQPNNIWVDTSTSTLYSKTYTLQLNSTGTYRVTAEFTFNGSYGSETVTRQATVTY